ncbi:MAG: class I SAM-dependent methyltransferase [Actinomycetota bacterium]
MRDVLGREPHLNATTDIELYARRLAGDSSEAASLAKLFLITVPVLLDEAARAIAPLRPEALVEMGLAELEGGLVRPCARVSAYEGLVLASDPPQDSDELDFVPGSSPAASRVERLTVRRPVSRALDIGAGSGVQTLLAAGHSEHVVAVDVNERALEYNRFNAVLNGASNVDIRHGSWFEPVAGERFDLIVANPPYVVSPGSDILYRDSGLPGDAVSRMLLREAPRFLEEGGFAHLMGNWVHGKDEDWRAPIEELIAGSGCDALLLKFATLDSVGYAAQWNYVMAAQGSEALLATVDRWLGYFREEQIEAISEVMVVLRRRSARRNWVRAIEVPVSPAKTAGDHVLRLFEARDRRDELADDGAVLASRLTLAPGAKLASWAEGPNLGDRRSNVALEHGVGFAAPVSPEIAEWLGLLDGSRRLDELANADSETLSAVRRLFALGLLVLP